MQTPCKDCPDRFLGCHSTCEKYIAFDKSRKEISEMRLKEAWILSGIINSQRRNNRKKRW